jgi:hypothetical protein
MRTVLAALCLLLLAGCAAPGPGGDAGGSTLSAGCSRHGDGLCGIGPQGKQNKR